LPALQNVRNGFLLLTQRHVSSWPGRDYAAAG
jgi:hypothetical protein